MPSMENDTSRSRTTDPVDVRIARLEDTGIGVLRYGLVFLLVVIGTAKYFAFEAQAIEPLVAHSPFLSWMLGAFGLQGTSGIIGTLEVATGLAIASRRLSPALSAGGSIAAVVTFLTTLSFLFSTPGAFSLKHPAGAFLMKDVVLLGASIATAAEALRASRARASRSAAPVGALSATRAMS
ncbi:DUF417 family protein [Anaeromyxobacter oryzae]|uniref:DUF417 family protein n=1 Tax=Anaeromyxobacter oryzae TaxID=2918170 RepID=A0ABN6N232_9BACT|nr:DUF417 family protein [Anaeromyxobacter oryzae]BDG06075.1 hypothetical protein AMOR_50710 [Anaeromyxobacter oryzae]